MLVTASVAYLFMKVYSCHSVLVAHFDKNLPGFPGLSADIFMSGSTGKTLSNGTLSLRFMQNAQRAKQQASVDLERAKVKDDAEWEVSREVRDAWGIPPSTKPATK